LRRCSQRYPLLMDCQLSFTTARPWLRSGPIGRAASTAAVAALPGGIFPRSIVEAIFSCAGRIRTWAAKRPLELVRAIPRKCIDEWEWLECAPKIRMLKEPVRRIRVLRQEEAERLIAVLPEHLAAMANFTLSTGLRAANVTGLQWTQVDLVRRVAWIHPDQAKARRAIPVPLDRDAALLLRQRLGKHPMYVFSYHGKRITQVSTKAWYAALKNAGIEDFRWHNLRHTWASWHVQAGTPLFALQEDGRLVERGDGAALRASGRRSLVALRREIVPPAGRCARNFGHKLVTVVKSEETRTRAHLRRGQSRIEPSGLAAGKSGLRVVFGQTAARNQVAR
jgi:hypothetical protein